MRDELSKCSFGYLSYIQVDISVHRSAELHFTATKIRLASSEHFASFREEYVTNSLKARPGGFRRALLCANAVQS